MKRIVIFLLMVGLIGCSYGADRFNDFITDPQSLLKDPHYAEHLKQANELERQYLYKEITYAEYMEKKDALENKYTHEVRYREDIIGDKN